MAGVSREQSSEREAPRITYRPSSAIRYTKL
jgi:hypothetical protein